MSDKPSLQDLLEVQAHFGLPSPALVEKDWHVVKALAAITAVDTAPLRLVFGGGTALTLPFLAFLIMRGRWVKLSFLLLSLLLAASVLLGRMHYSIDVFGAFFITYALHRAEARWFQPAYASWRRGFES